ncbi:MAG: chromate transporter, partial [Acidimicrobiales bacterium]|nr:chromate transporter [Acidimicrobiales bacterium]
MRYVADVMAEPGQRQRVRLRVVLVEWGRLGCLGFGGPPTHIVMLRTLCVERNEWLEPVEFEDAIAACNLLPGPASTQLAILCAWTVAGPLGAVVGGLAFIVPGLLIILGLASVFLGASPPVWLLGAGAGAGAAVAAVAVHAGLGLAPASWRRAESHRRWVIYAVIGAVTAATAGPFLVVVLIVLGMIEVQVRRRSGADRVGSVAAPLFVPIMVAVTSGGLLAVGWVALKVGALSYGGGFVIIPLMQHDAVQQHHWMTAGQFLDAVAFGQITPGPVVQTVAVVGYAAAGVGGGLLAAA